MTVVTGRVGKTPNSYIRLVMMTNVVITHLMVDQVGDDLERGPLGPLAVRAAHPVDGRERARRERERDLGEGDRVDRRLARQHDALARRQVGAGLARRARAGPTQRRAAYTTRGRI